MQVRQNNLGQWYMGPMCSPGKSSPQHKRSILLHQRLCAVQPIDHHLKASKGKQVLRIIHLQQRYYLVQHRHQRSRVLPTLVLLVTIQNKIKSQLQSKSGFSE